MNVVITAGATGGHIFPALSVALEMKKQIDNLSLLWIGTDRSREKELCEKNNIEFQALNVSGIKRKLGISSILALMKYLFGIYRMVRFFKGKKYDVVIAFGGYVCAPVLTAARFGKIPYFLHEQNSVPGLVNRIFSKKALCTFLGYPIEGKRKLKGSTEISGTPVRNVTDTFAYYKYPEGFDKIKTSILISGGSQGAASMNDCLIDAVKSMLKKDIQIVWQTGKVSYGKIVNNLTNKNAFIFNTIDDLYPYYAVVDLVICRSGASTLSEAAYFGIPVITIPLPWSSENHQWMNAGYVEKGEWGIRIKQDEKCGDKVRDAVDNLLSDRKRHRMMCKKAMENSPADSASFIVKKILEKIS